VLELAVAKDRFCGFEDGNEARRFGRLVQQLVPYSRHFCYEDGFKVGTGGIPFYSPCCHGAPGRHFPCKYLIPPPPFFSDAKSPPQFCSASDQTAAVQEVTVCRRLVRLMPMSVPGFGFASRSPSKKRRAHILAAVTARAATAVRSTAVHLPWIRDLRSS